VYLPWNAVVHRVPEGVTPELAGLVTPMANGVEWSLFDGGVGYDPRCLSGARSTRALPDVVCKAGGRLAHHRDGHLQGRRADEGAKELGADYVIDVQKEDPLARIREITGGAAWMSRSTAPRAPGPSPSCSA